MSTSETAIKQFMTMHPESVLYKLQAQQYDIQAVAASVYGNPDILIGNAERQSLGSGTGGIVNRQPVIWISLLTH